MDDGRVSTNRRGPRPRLGFGWLFACSLIAGVFIAAAVAAAEPGADIRMKRVFWLYSYHPSFPTAMQQIGGFRSAFTDGMPDLEMEFLDSKRLYDDTARENFHRLLAYKLSHRDPYDLVVTADDNAFLFVREYGRELFGDAPVVFLGVNDIDTAVRQDGNPRVTGVVEAASFGKTISLARALQPQRTRFNIVVDGTSSGQADLTAMHRAMARQQGAAFRELSLVDLSWDELRAELKDLGGRDSVLLLSAYHDRLGRNLSFEEGLALIRAATSAPIYHFWEHGIGEGALGGIVISHVEQGRHAGEMAKRILSGEAVASIPVLRESPNIPLFDYAELLRFSIDPADLPAGSVVLNEPHTFFTEYRNYIVGGLVVVMGMGALIVALVISVLRLRRAQSAMRAEAEKRRELSFIVNNSPAVAFLWRAEPGRPVDYVSDNVSQFGYAAEDFHSGRVCFAQIIHPEDLPRVQAELERHGSEGRTQFSQEYRIVTPAGETRWVDDNTWVRRSPGGTVTHHQGLVVDITERKSIEQQLVQSQKMEVVGQLTGGIAHDFNNLLAVVSLSLEMLEAEVAGIPKQQAMVDRALKAVRRGGTLTQRLLSFSRRQVLSPEPVHPRTLIDEVEEILRRALGETIEFQRDLAPDAWIIQVDIQQFESAILNLTLNARDAMKDGGRLSIASRNVVLTASPADGADGPEPGDYVRFDIADTGSGIPPDQLDRVFEPFFTTKDVGQGTGLGLSMVYGFVKQSRGHVEIRSTPGEGTTVSLFLPKSPSQTLPERGKTVELVPHAAGGRILVVEDEPEVRRAAVEVLRKEGYGVMDAADGAAALEVLRSDGPFDLIFTDIVLPKGMNGVELAERAMEAQPGLKCLFTSGYAEDEVIRLAKDDTETILKPYRLADLLAAVQAALDGRVIDGE